MVFVDNDFRPQYIIDLGDIVNGVVPTVVGVHLIHVVLRGRDGAVIQK